MWTPRTLLITDPNLGEAAYSTVSAICGDLTWISWKAGDAETRDATLDSIATGKWDLAISFYSDLVLTAEALGAIHMPLNIHPALPSLRGMGYDLIPLIENHPTVGSTLHRMERRVDSGEIFHVIEAPVPPERTYESLRRFNQIMSLRMLDDLCGLMTQSAGLDVLSARLRARGAAGRAWGSTYYSRRMVAALKEQYAKAGASMLG